MDPSGNEWYLKKGDRSTLGKIQQYIASGQIPNTWQLMGAIQQKYRNSPEMKLDVVRNWLSAMNAVDVLAEVYWYGIATSAIIEACDLYERRVQRIQILSKDSRERGVLVSEIQLLWRIIRSIITKANETSTAGATILHQLGKIVHVNRWSRKYPENSASKVIEHMLDTEILNEIEWQDNASRQALKIAFGNQVIEASTLRKYIVNTLHFHDVLADEICSFVIRNDIEKNLPR